MNSNPLEFTLQRAPLSEVPTMYDWRRMTPEERVETLRQRQTEHRPWHSVPHRVSTDGRDLITAACYEHHPRVGVSRNRMATFERDLLSACHPFATELTAWVVLPNHYHVLLLTLDLNGLLAQLGRLHGRTAHQWNGEDGCRGRRVWCGVAETAMKSDRHFWATVNYVHHNPIKHGYVERWQDWPFGNAREYLEAVGRDEAERVWVEHPIRRFGAGWDD